MFQDYRSYFPKFIPQVYPYLWFFLSSYSDYSSSGISGQPHFVTLVSGGGINHAPSTVSNPLPSMLLYYVHCGN